MVALHKASSDVPHEPLRLSTFFKAVQFFIRSVGDRLCEIWIYGRLIKCMLQRSNVFDQTDKHFYVLDEQEVINMSMFKINKLFTFVKVDYIFEV